jgi:hypothetical protein
MFIDELIGEIRFAAELGESLGLRGGERAAWIAERFYSRLPCQRGKGEETCGGFRVTPRGAVPCGCVRFRAELLPLLESGVWQGVLLNSHLQKGFVPPVPALAWSANPQGSVVGPAERSFLSLLIRILDSLLSVKGVPKASVSVRDCDARSLSVRILERLLLVQSLFFSEYHASFLWVELQASLSRHPGAASQIERFSFFEKLMQGRKLVVVDFGDAKLGGSGAQRGQPEGTTRAFEFFLESVSRADAGLLAFSRQSLLPSREGSAGFQPDFAAPLRRTVRDENNRLRFESTRASLRPAPCLQDVLSAGSWDRLLELLARGQTVLDSLITLQV